MQDLNELLRNIVNRKLFSILLYFLSPELRFALFGPHHMRRCTSLPHYSLSPLLSFTTRMQSSQSLSDGKLNTGYLNRNSIPLKTWNFSLIQRRLAFCVDKVRCLVARTFLSKFQNVRNCEAILQRCRQAGNHLPLQSITSIEAATKVIVLFYH